MSNYNIGLSADDKTAYVTIGNDALPGGATNVLSDFKHGEGELTDKIDKNPDNHVLFHHVQEALYHEGLLNMQAVKIVPSGALIATSVSADAIEVEEANTATIVLKYQPADATAANADFTFESSDTDVATVSSAGVVTGVEPGEAVVTATHKDLNLSVEVEVTVEEAA